MCMSTLSTSKLQERRLKQAWRSRRRVEHPHGTNTTEQIPLRHHLAESAIALSTLH
jgi:hypothetical protein